MNGYKILKCFRKEKRVSGELPCPATGLISFFLPIRLNLRGGHQTGFGIQVQEGVGLVE